MGTESKITVVGGVPFAYPFEQIDRVGDTIIAGNSRATGHDQYCQFSE
jgi:hypothetical protein